MDHYDVIIIGAGSAGMSYAALLAKYKRRVLVADRKDYIGGRAATRSAREWGWHDSDDPVNYGAHILPAKGFAELTLDILGVDKGPLLKKLNLPYIYKEGGVIEIPANLRNIFRYFQHISLREKTKLLKLLWVSHVTGLSALVKKYEKVSTYDLIKRYGLRSREVRELIVFVTGTSVQNLNLKTCPALDFMMMLKLMMMGIQKEKTIMYEVKGGYGKIYDLFKGVIEDSGGRIDLDREVDGFIVKNERVAGITTKGEDIFGEQTVFSGVPRDLAALLERSGMQRGFLDRYRDFGPAKIADLILLSDKRIHEADTNWLYLIMDDNSDREIFYVIMEEGLSHTDKFLYHISYFPHDEQNVHKTMESIKEDVKRKFHYDFSTNVLWSVTRVMDVHATERNIKFPFTERVGPETPIGNLFVIGDSYQAITTGTDGCAYSALKLAEKTLSLNFRLDKVL